MNAGRLNKTIIIEHRRYGEDGFGDMRNEAPELIRTRGDVRYDKGARLAANGEILHAYDLTFILWDYMAGRIDQDDRIIYQEKKYIIESMEPVAETRSLYIKASLEHE